MERPKPFEFIMNPFKDNQTKSGEAFFYEAKYIIKIKNNEVNNFCIN